MLSHTYLFDIIILPSLSQLFICSFASHLSPAYKSAARYGLTESALPYSPFKYFITISAKKVLPYLGKSVVTTACFSLSKRSYISFVCTVFPLPSMPVITINLPCIIKNTPVFLKYCYAFLFCCFYSESQFEFII